MEEKGRRTKRKGNGMGGRPVRRMKEKDKEKDKEKERGRRGRRKRVREKRHLKVIIICFRITAVI